MTQWQRQRDQQQGRLNAASRVADRKRAAARDRRWIDVIPYLQRAGLKVTAVQPYTFEDGSGLTALAAAHRT